MLHIRSHTTSPADDRRHVVTEDGGNGQLNKGDQIFQVNRTGAAVLSHQVGHLFYCF
jgi:hypothetical protein